MARVFKKRDSWWIDYYHQGRRYRQKVGAKRKAEDALAQVRTRIAAGEFVPPDQRRPEASPVQSRRSFKIFVEDSYLPFSEVEYSANHFRQQRVFLRSHLLPLFGSRPLSEITRNMIEDYRLRRVRQVSKATVNREVCCLRRVLREAVARGLIEQNPAVGVTAYKETPHGSPPARRSRGGRLAGSLPR